MAKEMALTDAQIAEKLKGLPKWRYEGGAIRRQYQTDGWPTTLMLVNAIGFYAESADHHPDLGVHWGSVEVALNTHSAGGLLTRTSSAPPGRQCVPGDAEEVRVRSLSRRSRRTSARPESGTS